MTHGLHERSHVPARDGPPSVSEGSAGWLSDGRTRVVSSTPCSAAAAATA